MDAILGAIPVLPLVAPADEAYASIRTDLERTGTPTGHNDLLIAAQARSLNLILVTENAREFRRVVNLEVETWE